MKLDSNYISSLSKRRKHALFENVTLDNRAAYHAVSERPLTKQVEDDMELLSDLVTWGELFLDHWQAGSYLCSRCSHPLYHSDDKWKGPCVWPSFRKPASATSLSTTEVSPYNNYTCVVKEVYCGQCELFIGHQFEDGVSKGDTHPEAHWRH